MTEAPLPGDIRQVDIENECIDDEAHANPDQADIGTFEPGDDVDDTEPAEDIDDLPDVGPLDPDEEPILDELEDDTDG